MNLPFASGLIEVQKLRQKLGYVSFCMNVEWLLSEMAPPLWMQTHSYKHMDAPLNVNMTQTYKSNS